MSPLFSASLKQRTFEEFCDYYFFRRLAHLLVPSLIRWKLSPNQITFLSLLVGLSGAYLVWQNHFITGALVFILAIILDCCDGQVARLTGQTSPLGRASDGVVDMFIITGIWLGIYFSGYFQQHGFKHILWLMIPSALTVFWHCWGFDEAKIKFLELTGATNQEDDLDVPTALREAKASLKKLNLIAAFLFLAIAFQQYFFIRGSAEKKTITLSPEEKKRRDQILRPRVAPWAWIGEGHHNVALLIGLLLTPISPWPLWFAFWIILVPMSLWRVYCGKRWQDALSQVIAQNQI